MIVGVNTSKSSLMINWLCWLIFLCLLPIMPSFNIIKHQLFLFIAMQKKILLFILIFSD